MKPTVRGEPSGAQKRRVPGFAVPEAVVEMAESLVRSWRTPAGEYGAEWDQAQEVHTAIEVFRQSAR